MDQPPFFPGDHPRLRATLHRYLDGLGERLAASPFADRVSLLLLAGGYGRGEGGVFVGKNGVPALYNDLEFYLVMREGGEDAAVRAWCAGEAHGGEEETGIEVEFKVLGLWSLADAEPSMFFYDLLAANVCVFGDAAALAALPARLGDASSIPAHEATRLLFNRGTGLLFCAEALRTGSARVSDGFVERNHAKMRLALADAVLACNGRYHFSTRERQRRLAEPLAHVPPNWARLVDWHREAVDFKFHPRHEKPGHAELTKRQNIVVAAWCELFLWLESARLGHLFADVTGYATYAGRLFPEMSVRRNVLLHVRDVLRRRLWLRHWRDYPRAALQKALALLLTHLPANGQWRPLSAHLLCLPADAAREQIEAKYRLGWQHYN